MSDISDTPTFQKLIASPSSEFSALRMKIKLVAEILLHIPYDLFLIHVPTVTNPCPTTCSTFKTNNNNLHHTKNHVK